MTHNGEKVDVPPFATFDRDTFPIITITFTGEKATRANFGEYLDELSANYDRKVPFALVFDASQSLSLNPIYQKQQADWMKQNEALIVSYCRGSAFVIPGAMMRNILKMIFAISRHPVPFRVFSTVVEARQWTSSLVKEL